MNAPHEQTLESIGMALIEVLRELTEELIELRKEHTEMRQHLELMEAAVSDYVLNH